MSQSFADTVAFVHVMSRVVMLVCAVLMQVASGYSTNRMGPEMKSLLVREKISIQSQLSGGSAASLSPSVRERMNQSCELLDSVGMSTFSRSYQSIISLNDAANGAEGIHRRRGAD